MRTIRRKKQHFIFLSLILLFLPSCYVDFPIGLTDEKLVNITLEEAQSLVPFTICLPAYIPQEINPEPAFTYQADWGDPVESQIRIRYSSLHNEMTVIEIVESHSPGVTGLTTNRSKNSQESVVRGLIEWKIDDKTEIDHYWDVLDLESTHFSNNGIVWWLFEIEKPQILRSIVLDWLKNPVYYVIYTDLSKSEAENLALSMITSCFP